MTNFEDMSGRAMKRKGKGKEKGKEKEKGPPMPHGDIILMLEQHPYAPEGRNEKWPWILAKTGVNIVTQQLFSMHITYNFSRVPSLCIDSFSKHFFSWEISTHRSSYAKNTGTCSSRESRIYRITLHPKINLQERVLISGMMLG